MSVRAAYTAFAAFGLFWGTWGAMLPALRDDAGLGDSALGTALLFVGLGALPAMLLTGRAVDRVGAKIAGPLLIALAVAGVLTASIARDLPSLAVGMALVGAASGAADVAANALAGFAEQRSGTRAITIAHAMFSSFVVIGSLGAGALGSAGASGVLVFAVAGGAMAVAGIAVLVSGDAPVAQTHAVDARWTPDIRFLLPFVTVGLIGALGFAIENAHQSWSAIFLADELDAAPVLTALAPATFAAFAAATRFAAGLLTRIPPRTILIAGALAAVAGTTLLGFAQDVPVALVGLAVAAIGTSVLFPSLLSISTSGVPDERRGRATSAVATTAYLGFVLGPVYVGFIAGAIGLREAMFAVAALAVAFAVLAPQVGRRAARETMSGSRSRPLGSG